jgi:hypothetical protein
MLSTKRYVHLLMKYWLRWVLQATRTWRQSAMQLRRMKRIKYLSMGYAEVPGIARIRGD